MWGRGSPSPFVNLTGAARSDSWTSLSRRTMDDHRSYHAHSERTTCASRRVCSCNSSNGHLAKRTYPVIHNYTFRVNAYQDIPVFGGLAQYYLPSRYLLQIDSTGTPSHGSPMCRTLDLSGLVAWGKYFRAARGSQSPNQLTGRGS